MSFNLLNQKFGRLIVLKQNLTGSRKKIQWDCECDCGNICVVATDLLRSGKKKSCGCLKSQPPPNKVFDRVVALKRRVFNATIIRRTKQFGFNKNEIIAFEIFLNL